MYNMLIMCRYHRQVTKRDAELAKLGRFDKLKRTWKHGKEDNEMREKLEQFHHDVVVSTIHLSLAILSEQCVAGNDYQPCAQRGGGTVR